MEKEVDELSSGIGSVLALMRDLTLPILSIFSGKSFSATIKNCLGECDIRDCWINFFCITCCVSSPYTTETIRVHREGLAHKFIRASMSVVGYLPPVYHEGELLVDGGYVNNLPSDEMQKMGVHTVIGVDVEDKDESMYRDITPLREHVSGWWVLGRRMLESIGLGGHFKIPRQSDILSTLCYVSHTNQLPQAKGSLDLYLTPPIEGYKLLDYHKKEEIVEAAYQYSLVELRKFMHEQKMEGLEMGPMWTNTRSATMPMLGTDRETPLNWENGRVKLTPTASGNTTPRKHSPTNYEPAKEDSVSSFGTEPALLREGSATLMIQRTSGDFRRRRRSRTFDDGMPALGRSE
uniref:PNPLA domain-containing protein n=1 Tax=Hemiselmis tepida TaxID=464990 RepID=A0A7S0Z3A7_9CRYP